jgi:hypothetical protein
MTDDRAFLEKLAEHFIFLKRLAESPGPIRCNGKPAKKWEVIAFECQEASDKIVAHMKLHL